MSTDRPVRIVVVGGANTDVVGHSVNPLIAHDSNPGHASVSAGGVGRNIAENLARLGADVALVTAFGGDHNARELQRHARAVGVDTSASLVCDELPGSVYLAILDADGDMALALSDMRPLERLTPEVLERASGVLAAADLVVCDTNLSEESLVWLAEMAAAPLLLDPVSTAKAGRAHAALERLDGLKCNIAEAQTITGLRDEPSAQVLAQALLSLGCRRAFVTDGARGVAAADAGGAVCLEARPVPVLNATGAGDAFAAGVALALCEGATTTQAAQWGRAMSELALRSETTVSERVSRVALMKMLEELS
ncbi:MAG: carbohydrate kinase family protein [Coriobacteriia bacterium]|nr:carbohydrate kinase family protein [Coriobacteriia bacterium]